MIYDCFLFFNEVELLEIRLHDLSAVVDRFVLVESPVTFSNKPKPLYYADNRDRFKAFEDRIIHVVVDDNPPADSPFDRENHQRNCIARGLAACHPDDVVLISDLDEIPKG